MDLPVTNMDAAGKTLAERAISSIKERGHTNLSGGIIGALQVNGSNQSSALSLINYLSGFAWDSC